MDYDFATNIDYAHEWLASQLDLTCWWDMRSVEYDAKTYAVSHYNLCPIARGFIRGQRELARFS